MRPVAALLMAGLLLGAGVAGAQDGKRVKCVGDSITEGARPFDEEGLGGYPGRLQPLLREGGLKGARVTNAGLGGDDSFEVLARIGGIFPDTDTMVLTVGTNDVDDIVAGRFTLGDTIRNIDFMMQAARSRGIRTIVGTIPPRVPRARRDSSNLATYQAILAIRELAHARRYEVADFWHIFPNRLLSTYELYFYGGREDRIGHPNAAGFAKMAELVAGVILDGDNQSPVDGRVLQPGTVSRVNSSTTYEMEIYEFDTGIQTSSATFVINGKPVETTVTGGRRKATLLAEGDGRRRCKVVLSVRAMDRAEPQNELDFFINRFDTPQRLIPGDANGDCRVDGRDLAIFGPIFGKSIFEEGYDDELDFVNDGVIDGNDFAKLASNFGKGEATGPDR